MPELMELIEDWKGYVALHDVKKSEGYEKRLTETIDLLSNARGLPAHRHEYLLREALTTSDFPYLFGDVLDRQVLANYKAVDPVWRLFTRQSKNKDFKDSYRFAITGGDQYLAEVGEKGEYLASKRTEAKFIMALKKYGRQFDISWEALVNDDLDALKDTPSRFATAATRTEHRLVTARYQDDDGTHAAGNLYDKATAGEINGSAALLTIANLETALEAMAAFRDANGEPIQNKAKFLVVPPSLELTARQILTSATKMWMELGGAGGPLPYPTANVVSNMGLVLVVDPYLPVLDADNGATGWYLFADPKDIAAIEAAYLGGHERPEICMKNSNKVSVGGGSISPFDGDFATDNVFYRVRLVFGTCKLDWRATYGGGLVN